MVEPGGTKWEPDPHFTVLPVGPIYRGDPKWCGDMLGNPVLDGETILSRRVLWPCYPGTSNFAAEGRDRIFSGWGTYWP